MNYTIIVERLKELRKKQNFTQQNVSDILGIKRATYAKYENGQATPPINVFIRLATMYGVNVDYISGKENNIKNTASETPLEAEHRTEFFNFFLNMNDSQRIETLEFMKKIVGSNAGDKEKK